MWELGGGDKGSLVLGWLPWAREGGAGTVASWPLSTLQPAVPLFCGQIEPSKSQVVAWDKGYTWGRRRESLSWSWMSNPGAGWGCADLGRSRGTPVHSAGCLFTHPWPNRAIQEASGSLGAMPGGCLGQGWGSGDAISPPAPGWAGLGPAQQL